ncbi:MAG: molybdopterin-dependent oxidoreductase [Planctomycetota bacterium]|jgi:putative selenate reductase molybdopterin-binding subunit|nr:molybdopterin-dependent oxidoreductase [Planctomycetota bacterium]
MSRSSQFQSVGRKTPRVDAEKLALGRGTFADDLELPGMLTLGVLRSPHAHARIVRIDTSRAEELDGVACILHHGTVERIAYSSAGQGHPEPSPWDMFAFDVKVRHVGDRVAAVAAETPEIAQQALDLIEVEYEVLPAVLDPMEAMVEGAPVIHDEEDAERIHDANRNIVAHLQASKGDVEEALSSASRVYERTYEMGYVQHAAIEPHIALAWMDEDDRVVVRTATQVPFHCRRILARVLNIPLKRIRVLKPRVGGGFGGKQEILIEDLVALVALRTGRPVRYEMTRAEELHAARTRHPHRTTLRAGVDEDGRLVGLSMNILENSGAYGCHALTVMCVAGDKALSLYRIPALSLDAIAVYTNLPVGGAFRGYGAPQGFFPLESLIDEIANDLGKDPLEYRRDHAIRSGDPLPMSKALGEGREGFEQTIGSSGLFECIETGGASIDWKTKRSRVPGKGRFRRGVGMACAMQGSGIPGIDMAAAGLKMNEDGSFNLTAGATDIGTGADTMLAQIVAEALTCSVEDVLVYTSDTDLTPFDTGAYASSTTYLSGGAAKKAAEDVKEQITVRGARMLEVGVEDVHVEQAHVVSTDGRKVSFSEICLDTLYVEEQFQIQAVASHMSYVSPPPFAAQFAEVEVDVETGIVRILRFVSAIDCGVAVNPQMAEGQVEGAVVQGLGYAISEEMIFTEDGSPVLLDLQDYHIPTARDLPELVGHLVETYEETGPFGAKAVAEIPIDAPAPAVANAVFDAVGVRIYSLPVTPEKVWRALQRKGRSFSPDTKDKNRATTRS